MGLAWKKNVLFACYLIFNANLALVMLAFDHGYLLTAVFVVGGHLRDFISVAYQLMNMRKILKPPPNICHREATHNGNTICCLVPVYREDLSMLMTNLEGLTTQSLPASTRLVVVLLFDGRGSHNNGLFASVSSKIDFTHDEDARWYESWKSKEPVKLTFRIGRYNDTTVILSHKERNSGKKDSLIMGEHFVLEIPDLKIGISQIDFIYHTDGDTSSSRTCLHEMLKALLGNRDLDGVSGFLRAYARPDASFKQRGFVMMQDFQYFFSLVARRMTESLMGATTCLPGCSNMIRVTSRSKRVIDKYASLPADDSNLIQAVTRMQGTDRRYTTLLLREGSNLQMSWRAVVYTEPPLDATSFINQRRRWSSNAFFNSLAVLYSNNIPLYIKWSCLVDIGRVFSTLFRFFSYACFFFFASTFSTLNIALLTVFIVLPYLYAFVWISFIVPDWTNMVVGFFLNKAFMPFLSVVAVTKMFFTCTNFAWGATTRNNAGDGPSRSPPGPDSSAEPRRMPRKDLSKLEEGRSRPDGKVVASGYFCPNPKIVYAYR